MGSTPEMTKRYMKVNVFVFERISNVMFFAFGHQVLLLEKYCSNIDKRALLGPSFVGTGIFF